MHLSQKLIDERVNYWKKMIYFGMGSFLESSMWITWVKVFSINTEFSIEMIIVLYKV